MCGRFSLCVEKKEFELYLEDQYGIFGSHDEWVLPRYNIAPGQDVISIINDGKKNRVGVFKWGLVPPFATDEKIGYNMINAKAETLIEKPSFKPSLKTKRCIILANGFYEWKKEGKKKAPMRFVLTNQTIFPLAGLWSTYIRPDGTKLHTCTIITTQANQVVSALHDRMPVILTAEARAVWLNPMITNSDALLPLLAPYSETLMSSYPVSDAVNRAENDAPECVKAL